MVQSVLCVGIAKLMLAGLVTDPRVRVHIRRRIQLLISPTHNPGADEYAYVIHLPSDGEQPGAPAMPLLFLASLLILISGEPTSHAIGKSLMCD